MNRTILLTAAAAAAIAGGYVALMPADGCEPGEVTMWVEARATETGCERVTVQGECGTDLAIPVDAETVTPIPCTGDEPREIPLAEAYPWCLVGDVRHPEQTFDRPAICCVDGCYCAEGGRCRHIAQGGPKFYDVAQLCKLAPEAPGCEQTTREDAL